LLDDFDASGLLPDDKPEYEKLLFQLELLYVRIRINYANNQLANELTEKYLRIAKLLQTRQTDFNLTLQQRIAEATAMANH